MRDKVKVSVHAGLSHDFYECDGKTFWCTEIYRLKKHIAGREIEWVKGEKTSLTDSGVLTQCPVSDIFLNAAIEAFETFKEG